MRRVALATDGVLLAVVAYVLVLLNPSDSQTSHPSLGGGGRFGCFSHVRCRMSLCTHIVHFSTIGTV